jgi:cyclase
MLKTRIIPCLQLIDQALVKTVKFGKFKYIGDPINTVRIFNELEVDELCFLDIRATVDNRIPNLKILKEIANECFMPLSYGGGVKDRETAIKILSIGFEKIILNTAAFKNPLLVTQIADYTGSQSVIGSIDVMRNRWGKYNIYTHDGTLKAHLDPVEWAQKLEMLGAGELLITSMNQDGTVIANGGAGSITHIRNAVIEGKASAVALGSMVVFQAKNMGVLVNFPDKSELSEKLSN